jgi:hypothetical protein
MIEFLSTPIFYLTPYIFLWSILNGLITIALVRALKLSTAKPTITATAATTAIASIIWNWSIEFNHSTVHLNVDHPIFRISWADALNSICVLALTSLVLGLFINKQQPAELIARISGLAALVQLG